MFRILNSLHSKGVIHRQVEPKNFCMGLGDDKGKVFLIDFQNATRFADDMQNTFTVEAKHKVEPNPTFSLNIPTYEQSSVKSDLV